MIVAGIDPGKTGALGILHPDGYGECYDVPVIKLRGKPRPAWSQWEQDWSVALGLAAPAMIVIEDVSARPGQGVTSMFTFGRSMGFAHGIAAGARVPIHWVTPSIWKAKLGLLNSSKDASRELVRTLFPKLVDSVCRVKDDGRAEAILLAYYGRKYLA